MKNLISSKVFAVALVGAVIGMSGCKDKQQVAQVRTYDQLLKEETAKSNSLPKKSVSSTPAKSDHHVRTYEELLKEQADASKDPNKIATGSFN